MEEFDFFAWRRRCGFTQQQAAAYLGLTGRTVSTLEFGSVAVDQRTQLACRFIENIVTRKPVLQGRNAWQVSIKGSGLIAENSFMHLSVDRLADHGLSLSPRVKNKEAHRSMTQDDLVCDGLRAIAERLRKEVSDLVCLVLYNDFELSDEAAREYRALGWITEKAGRWTLTPAGRKRAAVRGRPTK